MTVFVGRHRVFAAVYDEFKRAMRALCAGQFALCISNQHTDAVTGRVSARDTQLAT
jgi:hypothetical protein